MDHPVRNRERGGASPPDPFQKQIDDHLDFLRKYGDVRTRVPSDAYRKGWDRIFKR